MTSSSLGPNANRRQQRSILLWNFAFGACLQLSTYVLGFLTVPYLTRVLEPDGYGALAFTIGLNIYAWIAIDWGFSTGATRDVASNLHDPGALRMIFWQVMSAKIILSVVVGAGLIAFLLLTPSPGPGITIIPALINIGGILLSVDWFVQGHEKIGWYAATTIGGRTTTVILMFLLVRGHDDVWIAAILQALSGLLGSLAGLVVAQRLVPLGRPQISLSGGWDKIRENRHYFLIGSNALIYVSAVPVILNACAGTAAVGFFAAADKVMRVGFSVMTPAATVMFPRTVRMLAEDKAAAAHAAGRSLLIQLVISSVLAAMMFFGADILSRDLMGAKMAPAAVVIQWLSPALVISAFNRVLSSQVLMPLGWAKETATALNQTIPVYIVLLAGLSYALGPSGAAIAFVVVELLTVVLYIRLVWRIDRGYLFGVLVGVTKFIHL